VVAAVVLVSPELVAAEAAEVVAQLVGAVVAVAEQVLVAEAQVLPLSLELLRLPALHSRQARRRLCSLRRCRPL
jgi:hypothetical protein